MPWVGEDKLTALEEARDAGLDLQRQVSKLEAELAVARSAGGIAAAVEVQLTAFRNDGLGEAALGMAEVTVLTDEKQRLTQDTSQQILATRRDELVASFRTKEAPRIRADLTAQYERDGTFEALKGEVVAEERRVVEVDVRDAAKASYRAEIEDPQQREAMVAAARAEFLASAEAEQERAKVRAELEPGWLSEAREQGLNQVRNEEEARKGEFVNQRRQAYLASDRARLDRGRLRGEHEKKWNLETDETLAQELDDTELAELLAQKAQLARERLARENRATELLGEFESLGIDVTALESGDAMVIYFGSLQTSEETEMYRPPGYTYDISRPATKRGVVYSRMLHLVARGDGSFVVRKDSFREDTDEWRQGTALDNGRVLRVGNRVADAVTTDGTDLLEQRIAAGMHLSYDLDADPTEFNDLRAPVVNVIVNGVSARTIDFTRKVGEKPPKQPN